MSRRNHLIAQWQIVSINRPMPKALVKVAFPVKSLLNKDFIKNKYCLMTMKFLEYCLMTIL
jgi:hypothetical protein